LKLIGLAALFAAGLLLAGGLAATGVADVTTTETVPVTSTVEVTTTEPATTEVISVEQTTTQTIPASTTGTTNSGSESSTPTWVWVVLAVLAAAVIGLLVALLTRSRGISAEDRQRRLDAAVANWATQGWTVENQTPGSAILRHDQDRMIVSVDDKGQISTRQLADS
jgi:hypothetical protein